jgi:hypothetical protein
MAGIQAVAASAQNATRTTAATAADRQREDRALLKRKVPIRLQTKTAPRVFAAAALTEMASRERSAGA